GSDVATNPGTDPSSPLGSLARAIELVEPGDTILLQSGPGASPTSPTTFFLDNLIWGDQATEVSGTAEQPILIRPQDAGLVELRPQGNALFGLRLQNIAHVQLSQLDFHEFIQQHAL